LKGQSAPLNRSFVGFAALRRALWDVGQNRTIKAMDLMAALAAQGGAEDRAAKKTNCFSARAEHMRVATGFCQLQQPVINKSTNPGFKKPSLHNV
jgi:hypothetical protein